MKKIDIENWNRKKNFEWFSNFSNSTYGCNAIMDVTEVVKYTKETRTSFFINLLYIVVKGLNSIEEMRMRLVDGQPVVFDNINPAITVMTKAGTYKNVRFKSDSQYSEFYKIARKCIEDAKNEVSVKDQEYNPVNQYNEYYITCLPWLDFTSLTHPIPDDRNSQCIPRICWGKYIEKDNIYKLTLNITVSHILVDGYPLSMAFKSIQELLDDAQNILK